MTDVKEKVKTDYLNGVKQKDIVEKYDISINTLKSWIKRYRWSDIKNNKIIEEVSEKKERTPKSKKGAPKKTRGAPQNKISNVKLPAMLNNKNATKHGAYEKIMYSTMTDEEIELISGPRVDEIIELEREVDILTVRELKYLKLIKSLKDSNNDLVVVGGDKTIRTLSHKGGALELDFIEETKEITERTVYAFELINKYEAELTRIQKQKSKVIESIATIKIMREKLEIEKMKVQTSESTEDKLDKLMSAIEEGFTDG